MDIIMPKMGESVNEGTIIKWHKKEGDPVKRDEIIFEISTDKVDTEIPSPSDGILSSIKVNEGETVEVGTVVAVISESGAVPHEKSKDESKPAQSKSNNTEKTPPSNQSQSKTTEKAQQPKQSETKTSQPKTESPDSTQITKKPPSDDASSAGNENLIDIEMPKMGESVMEGTVIKWYKKVGDSVKKDEPLFEISTDKVDTEIPSPSEGFLAEIMVGEQETVEVGTIVARLSLDKPVAKQASQVKSAESNPKVLLKSPEATPETPPVSMQNNFSSPQPSIENKEETGFLSPLVLNIAKTENISYDELKTIKGTGLERRITKKDVLLYIDRKKGQKAESAKPAIPSQKSKDVEQTPAVSAKSYASKLPEESSDDVEVIHMDNVRQKIMQHMVNSRDTSVHVTALIEVDMMKIHNFIQNKKSEYLEKEGIKLTYMPFIADAVVKALKEFPLVNSTIDGTTIYKKKNINLGIAVAMEPNGLIVPNIKKAGEKNFVGLAKSISELALNARSKKITPDDISHGTFTITNYGVFGTIFGTPIINQPEVAILGVGAVIKKPVAIEIDGTDSIAIRPIMAITLAHDHRLIDGMLGGKFLKFVKDILESFNPASL
jgi:pyruvate dehydrogenase E2 component (dihydrolipoamide acetyltransferase)